MKYLDKEKEYSFCDSYFSLILYLVMLSSVSSGFLYYIFTNDTNY